MQIAGNTLTSMEDFGVFKVTFEEHVRLYVRKAILKAILSEPRLRDAHYAWREDLSRVEKHEPHLSGGLDHFKQCAHLAYWLRRQAPIIEYRDMAVEFGEEGGLYEDEIQRRELIAKFGSEFLAFDFGFQFCLYYSLEADEAHKPPVFTREYLIDLCHMLKFKHVSPHSLYLIYRSLFLS